MTDLHRLPQEREAAFWDAQRALNRAPLFCCEGVETVDEIVPRRRLVAPAGLILGGVAMAALLIVSAISIARAAERGDHMRPHEITLLIPPGTAEIGSHTISAAYPDRAACEKAKQRVTVKAPGAKLVCGIADPWRVR